MSGRASRLVAGAHGRPHGSFSAMASPWEVHVAGAEAAELQRVTEAVAREVWRIEGKYSRYRADSIVQRINQAGGATLEVDDETARLLTYAADLWQASAGLFDISTGALRRVWTFDGSDRIPAPSAVDAVLPLIGWHRVRWEGRRLRLEAGMEIDFGGIGKEYAVDRALAVAAQQCGRPVLVNGGGDLAASAPPGADQPWHVGIDTGLSLAAATLRLYHGALATSGDARRFLLREGRRYSHVLDPHTGWPVPEAPRSVTVLAATCSEAGAHATIALLKGAGAERYLQEAEAEHWIQR